MGQIHEVHQVKIIRVLILFAFIAACSATGTSQVTQRTPVHLLLPFQPDVQFAPFYVALENGYFEEEGLEVDLDHFPENEAVTLVGASEASFAIVSGEQVLLARAQGLPVVYVMAWWDEYPIAVAVPEDSPIQTPSDLAGKKVGLPGRFGASYIGFRALLDASGIDESSLQLDAIGYNQVEAMLAGQEDAIVVYANNEPIQLQAEGLPMRLFRVADYVHLASNGLITNEDVIQANPDLISRLIRAILRGIEDSAGGIDRAYEISKNYVEGLDHADPIVQREVLAKSAEFWSMDHPGFSKPEAWENMQSVLLGMGLLEKELVLQSAFNNEFIP
jgi:NitT/TauT family transport system substrate-binding protein